MGAPQKYLFDLSFDQPEGPAVPVIEPVEPTFTGAEIEAARTAGIAEGRAAALAETMESTERRIAAAVERLARDTVSIIEAREQLAAALQRDAVAVMRTVVRKVVPALCRKEPLAEIEALVADCLRDAFEEPRFVLRVADDLFEAMQRRLGAITAAAGYGGKVVLLADDTLASGDCRIEWADGGAERDTRRLLSDVETALARALETLNAPTPSLTEENAHG